jgi:hypothetical protein
LSKSKRRSKIRNRPPITPPAIAAIGALDEEELNLSAEEFTGWVVTLPSAPVVVIYWTDTTVCWPSASVEVKLESAPELFDNSDKPETELELGFDEKLDDGLVLPLLGLEFGLAVTVENSVLMEVSTGVVCGG